MCIFIVYFQKFLFSNERFSLQWSLNCIPTDLKTEALDCFSWTQVLYADIIYVQPFKLNYRDSKLPFYPEYECCHPFGASRSGWHQQSQRVELKDYYYCYSNLVRLRQTVMNRSWKNRSVLWKESENHKRTKKTSRTPDDGNAAPTCRKRVGGELPRRQQRRRQTGLSGPRLHRKQDGNNIFLPRTSGPRLEAASSWFTLDWHPLIFLSCLAVCPQFLLETVSGDPESRTGLWKRPGEETSQWRLSLRQKNLFLIAYQGK